MMRAALALLLLAAGAASAHVSSFTEAQNLRAGDWSVFFDVEPSPVYEGRAFNWSIHVGKGAGSVPVEGAQVGVEVDAGPGDVGRAWTLAPATGGYHRAPAKLDLPGSYNLSIVVATPSESRETNATFRVWRDLGARVVPADGGVDFFTNTTTDVRFATVDDAGARVDTLPLQRVRFEHWNDAHKLLIATEERALSRVDVGVYSVSYSFPYRGMYHLRVAGAGFGYNDTPILHSTALEPFDFDDESRGSPLPAAVVLAAVAVAVVLARRKGI